MRKLLRLALPVILAELGWIFMGVVDTIMVGPLGPAAIGAVSVGHIFIDLIAIAGIGLLLGLDTLVSQSFGAGDMAECVHSLWQGIYIAAVFSPIAMLTVYAAPAALSLAGVTPVVANLALPYAFSLQWSLPPLLFYAAFRRYLQGVSLVRPVMFTLISANVINYLGNAYLIPHYGVEGAGWATGASRVYMAAVLAAVAVLRKPGILTRISRPDFVRIAALLRLGIPAAAQILLEVGVFATATLLAGRLAPEALAAHHVLLNIAGTTFMVPLGLSSAAAVSVGHAIGAGKFDQAKRSGWLAVVLGGGFMAAASVVLLAIPDQLIGIFTTDPTVFATAIPLLLLAALFQLFDGVQVVTTGVLRGAGETRMPMLVNLMGHWLVGLPAGYTLCFILGFGIRGLWMGLSMGLILVGSVLLVVWARLRLPLASASRTPAASS
ncbi:MAG TPA: MATE family efflux transporter [Bryobacteraceae bacterium]|nr:MATE family efflux transporter [Bryobacteraceae bacterium]